MGTVLQSYKKLFDSISAKKPRRFYFLFGKEEFMKKEFVSSLIQATLPGSNRAFNLDMFYGDEFDLHAFDDRVSSYPLFADHRMVLLKKFDALSLANKDFVISRVASIPDALTIVIESSADKMDNARMKKLKELADAQGISFNCRFLSDEETAARVRARLKKDGFEIEPAALELLIESVGTKLLDLVNEIDKVTIIAQGRTTITRDLVKEVIGKYRTESVFAFLDGMSLKHFEETLTSLNRLLDSGEEPVFVLAMMLRRTLLLLQVKLAAEGASKGRGGTQTVNAQLEGEISPFLLRILARQAQSYNSRELELLLENLMWADEKIKSSQIPARTLLEAALLASCQRKKLATFSG
jgi:DNA polymerase-3 subunit delta